MASRSLGTLTLDVVAKIGGFVRGMDEAERKADKTAREIARAQKKRAEESERAWKEAGSAIGLALTAAAASVAYFVRESIGAIDSFNDLKDATGASIENISAIDRIARQTGTNFDNVSSILIKFNNVLKEADPRRGPGAILKALNLDIETLKKLDPAEALRQTAVAIQGFADNGDRARAVQELFGKSVKDAAPFLNDLSEQQTLVGQTTAKTADEIDKYNKMMSRFNANIEDASRAIAGKFVPAFNLFFEDITTFNDKAALAGMASDVIKLKKELDGLLERKNLPANPFNFAANLDAEIAIAEKKLADAKERFNAANPNRNAAAQPVALLPSITVSDPESIKLAEQSAKELSESYQRYYYDPMSAFEEEQTADQKRQTEERNRLFFEAQAARQQEMKQWFESIDAEQEAAIQAGKELLDSYAQDAKRAQEIGNSVAMTFASAFEDAIVTGQKFSEVLKGITQDLIRIAVRQTVTQPLFNSLANLFNSTGGTGGGTSGGTASFDGGGFTGSGARTGGLDGKGGFMAMLHPQETVIDHTKGSYSSMGNVQGSQQMTYAPVYNIDARADRAELLQLVDRSVREGNAQLVDQLQRQGRI